ncbi:ThiF family adenylyltransferase [Schaalia sp. ZJ1691]|uniref:ThiF family adenylyltransferase n=1 Tax=Schaalia sp. ZJ1691 TaxID=2709404 RepID=UPI0013ED77CA|nr:ThiF family adenylyltransferase [Schaalia sp. ZJ1691]
MSTLSIDELRRVERHLRLPGFGMKEQLALHDAHILIIGAGGLGCPALQQLAAAGVGRVTLIDDDVISLSNIHRQILFGVKDVGRPKVEVAAERARELQPGITITPIHARFTPENACDLLGQADVVIEGSDNFATKYLCADAAEITSTPMVWGTVLRFAGDVCVFHSGPLAPDGRGVGLRDVFPIQPDSTFVDDCATAGVLGVTTSVVAGLMVTATIQHITGLLRPDLPQLIHYEALAPSVHTWNVSADPLRELVTDLGIYEDSTCAIDPTAGAESSWSTRSFSGSMFNPSSARGSRSVSVLLDMVARGEAIPVDIREDFEVELRPWPGCEPVHLPMSSTTEIPSSLKGKTLVVACAKGIRSARFVQKFSDSGADMYSLPGGIDGLVG